MNDELIIKKDDGSGNSFFHNGNPPNRFSNLKLPPTLQWTPHIVDVGIQRMNGDATIPIYNKEGDSGYDLIAMETKIIFPGETAKIPTGLAFEIPLGWELQLRPRSGLSSKTKLRVIFGTIDSNYRGEVSVVVDNSAYPIWYLNKETMMIEKQTSCKVIDLENNIVEYDYHVPNPSLIIYKGQRIAQGVLAPVGTGRFTEKNELSETNRGTTGFGHSGI